MIYIRILIVTAVVSMMAALAVGQGTVKSDAKVPYKTGKPSDWPKESDALVAAPKNHRLLLENEEVRVLDVTVAPGEIEHVHSHRWPSVLYIMSAGEFVDRDGEGHIIFDTRTLTTPLQLPLAMWKEPEAPHSIENLSKTITIHGMRVEIKK